MFIGLKEEVGTRAPDGDEISPAPVANEYVVFSSHMAKGLALPASSFLREFLEFYSLQLHHLGANSITLLSCFVTLREAYLGIWPCMEVFVIFFFLRAQTSGKRLRECGSVSIYTKNVLFPKVHLPDSIKKWQNGYFYVRNLTASNRIGLPGFVNMQPADRSWNRRTPVDEALESAVTTRMRDLVAAGLTSRDLTLAWLSRRVLPL